MAKMTANEIRTRLLNSGNVHERAAMPVRVFTKVNPTLSRLNAILARRKTFKQQAAEVI